MYWRKKTEKVEFFEENKILLACVSLKVLEVNNSGQRASCLPAITLLVFQRRYCEHGCEILCSGKRNLGNVQEELTFLNYENRELQRHIMTFKSLQDVEIKLFFPRLSIYYNLNYGYMLLTCYDILNYAWQNL